MAGCSFTPTGDFFWQMDLVLSWFILVFVSCRIGWQLILILIPIFFIQPYLVQKRKNTWIGVIIHAGLNGLGFLSVAFGLV
jgi:hypothetical protein